MALCAFPFSRLAARCGKGGQRQRGGVALARRPLVWAAPNARPVMRGGF